MKNRKFNVPKFLGEKRKKKKDKCNVYIQSLRTHFER